MERRQSAFRPPVSYLDSSWAGSHCAAKHPAERLTRNACIRIIRQSWIHRLSKAGTNISKQYWLETHPQSLPCIARTDCCCRLTVLYCEDAPRSKQFYRDWFNGPTKVTAFTFNHLESSVLGDAAFDVGTYRQTLSMGPAGGNVDITGKYTVILKRSGEEWKISYLIFNGDAPSKIPPASPAGQ